MIRQAHSNVRLRRLSATTACIVLGIASLPGANAQPAAPSPGAALVHVDCATPRLDGRALFESLGLELQAQGISLIPLDALKSDDHFILEVRTDCDTRQQLVLRAARGVRSVEEAFSLADVPRSSEPRTVALALAELLEDFRRNRSRGEAGADAAADSGTDPNATVSGSAGMNAVGPSLDLGPEVDNAFREPPLPLVQDKPVEPQEPPGVHLLAMFGFEQRTFRLSTSLVGLDAGFSLEQAELGASLLRGTVQTSPTSKVTAVVGNLALGYRVADVTNGRWTASVTPRVGIGNLVTTVESEADDEGSSEIYGDVAVRISVNARLWSRLGVTLNSEAGYGGGVIPIVDGPSTREHTGLFLGVALNGSLDFSSRKASKLWPPVSAKEQ